MTLVIDKLRSMAPSRGSMTPSGWFTFNAPCCHHRGHRPDTKKRAGLKIDGDGIFYNCFNCKFSTGWKPGDQISTKLKQLVSWFGGNEHDINQLVLEALKAEHESYVPEEYKPIEPQFKPIALPEGCLPVSEWVNNYLDLVGDPICPVLEYLVGRGFSPFDPHFYWTPVPAYSNRVIMPFWYNGKIVGFTGRKLGPGNPKYLNENSPGFVFNLDYQTVGQKYLFVVEGIFDAIAINGVSVMSNTVNDQQARLINNVGAEQVIVIPDQDRAGIELFNCALKYGWSVAMPNWDCHVKDAADAVKEYGSTFTAVDAIKTAVSGNILLSIAKQKQEEKIKKMESLDEKPNQDFDSKLKALLQKQKENKRT